MDPKTQPKSEQEKLQEYLKRWVQTRYVIPNLDIISIEKEIILLMSDMGRLEELKNFVDELPPEHFEMLLRDAAVFFEVVNAYLQLQLYQVVFRLVQESELPGFNKEVLEVWDRAHYSEREEALGRKLTPLHRFRIRAKNPPPLHICPDGRRPTACLSHPASYTLWRWLIIHANNPYPTPEEKLGLAKTTGLSNLQVRTWFANARRRMRKAGIQEVLEKKKDKFCIAEEIKLNDGIEFKNRNHFPTKRPVKKPEEKMKKENGKGKGEEAQVVPCSPDPEMAPRIEDEGIPEMGEGAFGEEEECGNMWGRKQREELPQQSQTPTTQLYVLEFHSDGNIAPSSEAPLSTVKVTDFQPAFSQAKSTSCPNQPILIQPMRCQIHPISGQTHPFPSQIQTIATPEQPILQPFLPSQGRIHRMTSSSQGQPNSDQIMANSGHIQPNFDQNLPTSGHIQPNFDQNLANSGHIQPNSGHNLANTTAIHDPIQADSGRFQPNTDQIQSHFEEVQPNKGRIQPISSQIKSMQQPLIDSLHLERSLTPFSFTNQAYNMGLGQSGFPQLPCVPGSATSLRTNPVPTAYPLPEFHPYNPNLTARRMGNLYHTKDDLSYTIGPQNVLTHPHIAPPYYLLYGYPKGAVVQASNNTGHWASTLSGMYSQYRANSPLYTRPPVIQSLPRGFQGYAQESRPQAIPGFPLDAFEAYASRRQIPESLPSLPYAQGLTLSNDNDATYDRFQPTFSSSSYAPPIPTSASMSYTKAQHIPSSTTASVSYAKNAPIPSSASVSYAKGPVIPTSASMSYAKAQHIPSSASMSYATGQHITSSTSVSYAKAPPIPSSASVSYAKGPVIPTSASMSYAKAPPIPSSASVSYAKGPAIPSSAGMSYAKDPAIPSSASVSYANAPPIPSTASMSYATGNFIPSSAGMSYAKGPAIPSSASVSYVKGPPIPSFAGVSYAKSQALPDSSSLSDPKEPPVPRYSRMSYTEDPPLSSKSYVQSQPIPNSNASDAKTQYIPNSSSVSCDKNPPVRASNVQDKGDCTDSGHSNTTTYSEDCWVPMTIGDHIMLKTRVLSNSKPLVTPHMPPAKRLFDSGSRDRQRDRRTACTRYQDSRLSEKGGILHLSPLPTLTRSSQNHTKTSGFPKLGPRTPPAPTTLSRTETARLIASSVNKCPFVSQMMNRSPEENERLVSSSGHAAPSSGVMIPVSRDPVSMVTGSPPHTDTSPHLVASNSTSNNYGQFLEAEGGNQRHLTTPQAYCELNPGSDHPKVNTVTTTNNRLTSLPVHCYRHC